jgi:hypothetical protein
MKKIIFSLLTIFAAFQLFAQHKPGSSKSAGLQKAGDHLMLQFGVDNWSAMPDSIKNHKKGVSRGANIYVMLNKPFKGDKRFSAAFGVGVSTSNMYFSKLNIDIKSPASVIPLTDLSSSNRFKKYKLSTAFLEVPVELRFTANPENEMKSIKAALGVKAANILSVHTKGKNLEDKDGKALNGYTFKEINKHFFNTTRLSVTGRVGYGNISLFGAYAVSSLLKDGVGPQVKPYQIGICISGL